MILRQQILAYSLLEILIVCALVAILLSYAMPAYQVYVQRAYRSQAIEVLLAAASCQEQHFSHALSYDTNLCLPQAGDQPYVFIFYPMAAEATDAYMLAAIPQTAQAGDICGTLRINQFGSRTISGPQDQLRRCWEGR